MRPIARFAVLAALPSLVACGRVGFTLGALDASMSGDTLPPDSAEDATDAGDDTRTDAPADASDDGSNGIDAGDSSDDATTPPPATVMTGPCFDLALGAHDATTWNGSGVVLEGAAHGVFTTPICDAGSVVQWAGLAVMTDEPYGKGLSAGDTGYPGGNLDRTGLIAAIALDGSGAPPTLLDADGSAATVTDTNASLRYVPGVFGQGLSFDGVDDLMTIADDGRFDFAGGDFTLSAWVRTTNDCGHWCGFMGRQVRADGGITLEMSATDQANFFLGYLTMEYDNLTGGETISDDRFHHLVGVREGATATLYVDGQEATRVEAIAYPRLFDSTAPIELGGYTDGAAIIRAPAIIDDVSIWGRALGASEVAMMQRRGVMRVSLRVRTCDDPQCQGESFVGPDGTASTSFDESLNGASGPPTYAIDGTARYFQVEVTLEGDGARSPTLRGLTPTFP